MRNLIIVTTKPASKTMRRTQRIINTDYHRPFSSFLGEAVPDTERKVYQQGMEHANSRINVASGEDVCV